MRCLILGNTPPVKVAGANMIVTLVITLLLFFNTAFAAEGERKTITGEVMDTWCYVSQIMGPSDFVVGTTHHVCAVWCAAGGIPVGLLDKSDGQIYMIMSIGNDTTNVANQALLDIQSHEITVQGSVYELDGIKYLMIDKVMEDKGVTNLTHKVIGTLLPAEANPK